MNIAPIIGASASNIRLGRRTKQEQLRDLKSDLREINQALKPKSFLQRVDRKLLGSYPREKESKKELLNLKKELEKLIKLKGGKN